MIPSSMSNMKISMLDRRDGSYVSYFASINSISKDSLHIVKPQLFMQNLLMLGELYESSAGCINNYL